MKKNHMVKRNTKYDKIINDLQCTFVEVGDKLFDILCGGNTKVLSSSLHMIINRNDLVEFYNGIDNDICIVSWIDICYALKNAFPIFNSFKCSNFCVFSFV